jgi:hypothetical protein
LLVTGAKKPAVKVKERSLKNILSTEDVPQTQKISALLGRVISNVGLFGAQNQGHERRWIAGVSGACEGERGGARVRLPVEDCGTPWLRSRAAASVMRCVRRRCDL